KIANDRRPRVSTINRAIYLSASRAKVHATRIKRIDSHRIAQHVYITVRLRQTIRKRLPFVAARATAIDTQLSVRRIVLAIALDWHDVDRLRLVRVHVDHKT